MCVPKSNSILRHESFANTDEATKFILFTVTKSLLQTIPLFPEPDIIPPSIVIFDACGMLEVPCNWGDIGNEQGPPAKAYDGVGEGIALKNEK